jgi:hypothetical protein
MRTKWIKWLGVPALVGLFSGAPACAQQRDPINRVQPQAVAKKYLVGDNYTDPSDDPEFYARTMIINAPFGGPDYMFSNGYNQTTRIKWEIQEHFLIGRTSYVRIPGTESNTGDPTLVSNGGQIAYIFAIQSQFDIRRDYNPSTGEESNVIVENGSDRPWAERDFIRVDWSKNLNTSAYELDTLALVNLIQGAVQYNPVGYNYTDPNDPNAPIFDFANGYFDVTDVVLAEPQMIELPASFGGGKIPACQLPPLIAGGNAPLGLCDVSALTLRHSFRKVENKDYQAMDYDGWRFQNFGPFMVERYGYERQFGLPDAEHHRLIARYNIWQRSHYWQDPNAMTGPVACAADADCGAVTSATGVTGSTCDTLAGICTLPYRARQVRPIIWYAQQGDDPVYFNATRDATTDWDTAMRVAVAATQRGECNYYDKGANCPSAPTGDIADEDDAIKLVREVEACRRGDAGFGGSGGSTDRGKTLPDYCTSYAQQVAAKRGYSQAVVDIATTATPMVIICHSPVDPSDNYQCGDPGTIARPGDLRFNLVITNPTPNSAGLWGIMTDSNDPLTGEKVATSVNVFTTPTESISRVTVDTLRYIAGELQASDITEGTYLDTYIAAAKSMSAMQAPGYNMNDGELARRMAAPFGVTPAKVAEVASKVPAAAQTALQAVGQRVSNIQASADATPTLESKYFARMNKAAGSTFEGALQTQAMLQAAGLNSTGAAPGDRSASMLAGFNPTAIRELKRQQEIGFAKAGICMMTDEAADNSPLSDPALGDILQAKFGKFNPKDSTSAQLARAEKMRDFVRRRMHVGVIIHEMGHSFGLRHNFVSSSDPYNYRPQYWQLRTNDGKITTPCNTVVADGKTCVGPRRFDPATANEMNNLIGMWQHSSVMEYPGDSTQDLLTLGAYDFASVRAFYGDTATVYDTKVQPHFQASSGNGKLAIDHQANFGGIIGIQYHVGGSFSNPLHYSQLQSRVGMIQNCKTVNTADFKPANWDDAADGAWHPMLDGFIVTNEDGATTRCQVNQVDFMPMATLTPSINDANNGIADASGNLQHPMQADPGGRVRVPYGFASDEWADLGNSSVYRHDNGGDVYEQVNFWVAQQEANHIFQNYRRGRALLNIRAGYNRTLSRYHEKMRDMAKGLGLYVNIARDTAAYWSPTDGDAFAASILGQVAPDLLIASSMIFDHFAHVMARPEPGDHALLPGVNNKVFYYTGDLGFTNPPAAAVTIPNGVFGGANGGFNVISLSGRPIENALANNKGEYDRDYTQNIGAYYEKAYMAMEFTESVDNFISSAPNDFIDPRQRSVSMADLFGDGFRRWLGNNLTGDEWIKGVRIAADGSGNPLLADPTTKAPKQGIGWTSWWPSDKPSSCFPGAQTTICFDPNDGSTLPGTGAPANTAVVNAQVGWEQQKFLIAMTYAYLPENQRWNWFSQLYVWEQGVDSDPGLANRIEFHDPNGSTYVAATYGTETIFGKTVQKAIGARVLEWANTLLQQAYVTKAVTSGSTTWYVPVLDTNGLPQVLDPSDSTHTATIPNCAGNQYCVQLQNYISVIKFMRQAITTYGIDAELKGVY